MYRPSQILLACQDALRWQLASNRLCNKTSSIIRMGCCRVNTSHGWSPDSEIWISMIRWFWNITPGSTPCLKIFRGSSTAASKLLNLHPSGCAFPGRQSRIAAFMNFFLLFTGQNIHKHLSFSNGLFENIKGSRRISLRTIGRNCVKHFCLGSSLSRGFGPFSGLAIPYKDFDRTLGYPLAAFSFAMPFLAG